MSRLIELETLQVHADERGALLKAWPRPVTGEVYVVELRAGTSRGHHLHRAGAEWFIPLVGVATLVVENPDTGERDCVRLEGVRARVAAGLAHALFGPSQGTAWVMAVADAGPEDLDTVRHQVAPE